VSPENRTAVVQPAVTNLELQTVLAPLDFYFAPDPASQKVATIGGNVAENSGGPHCLKYGVTTNHVLGLGMILADGEAVSIGGAALDPPGYDLRGVVIGSEGTLGIVTEATLRILPKPETVITQLAIYDDVGDAARSVTAIIAAGILPATLEMMDQLIIQAVEDSYACGYPRDAAAVLIIEVEGPDQGLAGQAEQIRKLCMAHGCRAIRTAADDQERNRLWEGRRGAFGAVARLAPNFLVNDSTVPRNALPRALSRISEIVSAHGFRHGNVFHAGDGNLHPLVLFDSRDEVQSRNVHRVGQEIMHACVQLGGTITGEHGVGAEKMTGMHLIFTADDLSAQRVMQRAFDPAGLLNPGKIIPTGEPESGEAPTLALGDPTDAEKEIGERIRTAAESGQAIVPLGSGTYREYGNPDSRPVEYLSSESLVDLMAYDPDNQVVSAASGMRLDRLQEILSEHHQWLPLRPYPALGAHSLGGLAALGRCGPERLRYGAPRDLLLGLRYANSAGELINAGGRVVKNVAGYDMTRLLTGTAGTLGFLTALTWRVSLLPERCEAAVCSGSLEKVAALANDVITSRLEPSLVCAIPSSGDGQQWRLLTGFEGFSETVQAQIDSLYPKMDAAGLTPAAPLPFAALDGPLADDCHRLSGHPYQLRVDLQAAALAAALKKMGPYIDRRKTLVDLGCGRILSGNDELSSEDWQEIGEAVNALGGHAVLEAAPPEFKAENDVFGPEQPAWKIMHRIKRALDPEGIFAPGRLPGKV
jgi:glycolate oxidase subunit GlcD